MTITPALLLPIALWLGWVFLLYAVLSALRLLQMAGRKGLDGFERRCAANLSNQFEAPLLMLIAVAFLAMNSAVTGGVIAALWVFLAGRIAHSLVQIGQPRIIPRGLIFTVNFAAIVYIWGVLFLDVFDKAA